MLVFAANPSPRLKYILNQLLHNRLGISFKITDNPEYFRKSPSRRINYGDQVIEGCFNVPAIPLLFQETITEQNPVVKPSEVWRFEVFHQPFKDIPDLRQTTTMLSFDVFAASFFLLSRYEEYLPGIRDEHNRYRAKDSLAFRAGFLDIPLIDCWVEQLKPLLKKQYPDLHFHTSNYHQINTIDVDYAYKYWGHSWYARGRKFWGSLLRGKPDFRCIRLPKQDPYNTFDWMIEQAGNSHAETLFFLLLANYGGHDKNIPPLSRKMKLLSSKLAERFICGIHPSYRAAFSNRLYKREHYLFVNLMEQPATHSRHHFLKIKVPESYRKMLAFGVEKDYTMGYSTATGFRASTSFPFQLFDLHENKTLNVLVYSPCVMDVVLKNILQLSPSEAIQKIRKLRQEVQQVHGTFVSIWHNSSFDRSQGWGGWFGVYRSLFE